VLLRARRHAEPRVMRLQVLVEDAKLADDAATFIGEEWVVDGVLLRERLQFRLCVVGDPKDGVTGALEFVMNTLQLDQLRLAVRSPDRAAIEGYDRAPAPAVRVKIDQLTMLIRQANVREDRSDLGPSLSVVDLRGHFKSVTSRTKTAFRPWPPPRAALPGLGRCWLGRRVRAAGTAAVSTHAGHRVTSTAFDRSVRCRTAGASVKST